MPNSAKAKKNSGSFFIFGWIFGVATMLYAYPLFFHSGPTSGKIETVRQFNE
jgi:hypothetical protein